MIQQLDFVHVHVHYDDDVIKCDLCFLQLTCAILAMTSLELRYGLCACTCAIAITNTENTGVDIRYHTNGVDISTRKIANINTVD